MDATHAQETPTQIQANPSAHMHKLLQLTAIQMNSEILMEIVKDANKELHQMNLKQIANLLHILNQPNHLAMVLIIS